MDRRVFLASIEHGSLDTVFNPEILPNMQIRQYVARLQKDWESEEMARITAIGIGRFGASCSRLLAYKGANITCYDVSHNASASPDISGLNSLFKSIQRSDLLFLLTSYDDPYCEAIFTACAKAAESVGVLTVGVVIQDNSATSNIVTSGATFALPSDLLQPSLKRTPQPLMPFTNHAVLQLITSISGYLLNNGYIGIDFVDVATILRSGHRGWFGVGTTSGVQKASIAASLAVKDLDRQGFDPDKCSGFLACLHTSTDPPAFDFFEELSETLFKYFCTDIASLLTYSTEVRVGSSERVVIMAVA